MTTPPTLADLLALVRAVPAPATALPWRSTWGDAETPETDSALGEEDIIVASFPLEGADSLVLGTRYYDGLHPCCSRENAAHIVAVCNLHPTLAAAVERLALAASGDREALGLLVEEIGNDWDMGIDPNDKPGDRERRIGARLHALGATSAAADAAALRAELDAFKASIAPLAPSERHLLAPYLKSTREAAIEAARAEGYAAGLAAAAPPILAAVGALHGAWRAPGDTLSPPPGDGAEEGSGR